MSKVARSLVSGRIVAPALASDTGMAVASELPMTTKRVNVGFLLLASALSLQYFAACSGDDADDPAGSGGTGGSGGNGGAGPITTGGGAGPTTTGRGSGGVGTTADASTTGGPSNEGLFSCELALSCTPVCTHLGGLGDCGGDAACVESVWNSGESGVVLLQSRPGPGGYQSDTLFVLLGNGQALTQLRSRSCPDGDLDCNLEAIPWSVEDQQRCEMGANSPLQVEDCVSANYSCDAVKAMLDGAGGAGETAE